MVLSCLLLQEGPVIKEIYPNKSLGQQSFIWPGQHNALL